MVSLGHDLTLEKRKLAKGRGTADPSCFRPIGDLRVLRRLLRRGRRRARPWHGAAVPPRPLPPPRRLQGHEAARDTGIADSPSNRGSNLGPSRPQMISWLISRVRAPLSQESFWQIGFDDTVTNSMVEMSHQGLLPRHLLAAAARLSHSPLHRGRHACPGLLCVSDMQTDRRRVRLCGTHVPAQTRRFHCLAWPRRTARSRRARARATALMRARSWTRRAGRGWQHEPLAARGAEPEC